MSSKDSYNSDINKYENLKVQIKRIVVRLKDSADAAGRLGFKINSEFKINNDGAAVGDRAIKLKKRLNQTADYLKETILPAIDSAIGNAKEQIANIEQAEAEAASNNTETGVEA